MSLPSPVQRVTGHLGEQHLEHLGIGDRLGGERRRRHPHLALGLRLPVDARGQVERECPLAGPATRVRGLLREQRVDLRHGA